MGYQVTCDCGKAHAVTAADAGASLPCDCGRTVEVPPLHQLRHSAGEAALSADAQLEAMLVGGLLPGTADCVCCHHRTDHLVRVSIECDRPVVKTAGDSQAAILGCLLFGLVGWLLFRRHGRESRVYGRDVGFTVPLRVCESCDRELTKRAALVKALREVPVYAGLLDKYPKARITRTG